MATGNIDCPLPERNSNFPIALNYRYANTSNIPNMERNTPYLNGQPEFQLASTSVPNLYPREEKLELDNKSIQPISTINDNNPSGEFTWPSHAHQELFKSLGINDNDIFLQWNNRNLCGQQLMRSVIPEEQLSINVEVEEDSSHSWRPCATNSLSSDFFMPQLPMELSIPIENNRDLGGEVPQLVLGDLDRTKMSEPSCQNVDVRRTSCPDKTGGLDPRLDVQTYLQSQKSEMNILKYEVMNAKRKIVENRDAVQSLACQLRERELFENSQEIEKLRKENAQLRLECQCLCMEVDFYLKGQAPLGEIDEKFYQESSTAQSNQPETQAQTSSQSESKSRSNEPGDPDSLEEGNKWECHQCTFANHPAINCCEMCQSPRLRRGFQPSNDSCFCHPKEESESS